MSDTHITLMEFFEKHKAIGKDEIVLDVRRPEEYHEAHIAGALNIPVDQVAGRVQDLKKFNKVYIHCKRGGRAKTAFDSLSSLGLKNLICVHDAGMDLWIEKGFPVVKD